MMAGTNTIDVNNPYMQYGGERMVSKTVGQRARFDLL